MAEDRLKKVQQFMPKAIDSPEVLKGARAQQVLRKWEEVVGAEMAGRSWPDRWDKGTVWVACTGSAWAQELRMMKHDLLAKLGDLAGERDLFTDLRFGVRKLSRPVAVMAESLAPLESEVGEEPVLDLPKEEFKADSIRDIAKKRLAKWNDAT